MDIFTITMTPINPPHDDAVKNMVLAIAARSRENRFTFVSSLKDRFFPGEENVSFLRSPFQRVGRHNMTALQMLYVFILMLLMSRKTDIFQFFITPNSLSSSILRRSLAGKRSIQVISSIHTLKEKNGVERIAGLFFADRIVTYSDFAKNELEKAGARNVTRIYPGVDISRFSAKTEEKGMNIVYPASYGILDSSYSLDGLIGIARDVIAAFPGSKFIMACRVRKRKDALLRAEFIRKAGKAGLLGSFSFLDTVEDMPGLFALARLIIFPAERPSAGVLEIPMVLLEGAASSKCVIYGSIPPLDELESKGLGVMMAAGAPSDYAGKIIEMLDNKGEAARIGAASRKAVERYFSADTMAEEFKKLYEGLK